MKISKNQIVSGVVAVALAAASYVFLPSNDITLDPSVSYGILNYTQSGTEADPIVIDANGANIQCVNLLGDWLVFKNGFVHGCEGHGIYTDAKNIVIENNTVYDTVRENNSTATTCKNPNSGWGSAIKVRVGGDNVTIRGNTVHQNCGEGIAATRASNVMIENNIVWDNYSINIYIDNSRNVKVRNNIISCLGGYLRNGNRPAGIGIGEEFYQGWGAQLHDLEIYGNEMRDCHAGIQGIGSDVGGVYTNILIDNNTVYSSIKRPISWDVAKNSNVIISNNKLHALSIWVRNSAGVSLVNNALIGAVTPIPVTRTNTPTITATQSVPPTVTRTPTRTPTKPTPPTAIPTICETAVSDHFWFMGCTK